MKTRILVTGVGCPGGPGIISALKLLNNNIDVIGIDARPDASGVTLCDEFHLVPMANSSEFFFSVEKIVKKSEVNIIIPLVTLELAKFAKYRDYLKEQYHCDVLVSQEDTINIANDKIELYNRCIGIDIGLPDYEVTDQFDKLITLVDRFLETRSRCVIKPGLSNGSRGVRVVSKEAQNFESVVLSKPGSLSISRDYLASLKSNNNYMSPYMVCDYLDGTEITVDLVVNRQEILICMMRTRDQMRSGISTAGTFFFDYGLKKILNKIVRLFDFYGPVGFQFMKTKKDYFLIECNPRLQGTSMASMAFDLNIPIELVKLSSTGDCHRFQSEANRKFSRYYKEIFYDQK